MRNKALSATLEQRSTPLINGTEITLGAFFVALWRENGGVERREVIKKAKEACVNSQHKVEDHFVDILEMVEMGKVRKTIEELGGTMPEDLPVADSIKHLESKEQRLLKDKKEERGE